MNEAQLKQLLKAFAKQLHKDKFLYVPTHRTFDEFFEVYYTMNVHVLDEKPKTVPAQRLVWTQEDEDNLNKP